jgi:ATP-dependent Zn protease
MAMMQIVFDEHFSSVEKDLSKAKHLCADMIRRFGMGDEIVGDTQDEKRLLQTALIDVKGYLQKNETHIKELVKALLEGEMLPCSRFKEREA